MLSSPPYLYVYFPIIHYYQKTTYQKTTYEEDAPKNDLKIVLSSSCRCGVRGSVSKPCFDVGEDLLDICARLRVGAEHIVNRSVNLLGAESLWALGEVCEPRGRHGRGILRARKDSARHARGSQLSQLRRHSIRVTPCARAVGAMRTEAHGRYEIGGVQLGRIAVLAEHEVRVKARRDVLGRRANAAAAERR